MITVAEAQLPAKVPLSGIFEIHAPVVSASDFEATLLKRHNTGLSKMSKLRFLVLN